jgi:hypothetical protein
MSQKISSYKVNFLWAGFEISQKVLTKRKSQKSIWKLKVFISGNYRENVKWSLIGFYRLARECKFGLEINLSRALTRDEKLKRQLRDEMGEMIRQNCDEHQLIIDKIGVDYSQ